MERNNKRNRSSSGSSSVGVGITAFLLGFLFAFIVLIGSIFGVGYVALTTDINEVFRVFGLENVNKNSTSEDDKYNYINADRAKNLYELIIEISNLAGEGLGEINLNKIDALAPVTDAVLNIAYEYIDDVLDFDKDYFEDVPLTSIIDSVTNSVYYVRTSKVIETLNNKMGYSISFEDIPVVDYLVNGIEAEYATIQGGATADCQLPVLFDYYVYDEGIGYNRTESVNNKFAFPENLNVDDFICETTSKNADSKTLYKTYYVPCKVMSDGIYQADYTVGYKTITDPNVYFVRNGETINLTYKFRVLEYGADTDFIAVKPQVDENGLEKFVLDFATIGANKANYLYDEDYARQYYTGPKKRSDKENGDRMFGISTINGINYFKDITGKNIIEYDPLTVSDIMLGAMDPLYQVPIYSVVNTEQADVVKGIFGDTSLGAILDNNVNFNELINDIYLSTFLSNVRVSDKVMPFIVYNVSNITDDGNGNYTAIYDKGGDNEKTVKLEVGTSEDGLVIKSVIDPATGEKIKGNMVADLTTLTLDLTLDVFMDVKADDAIMAYLGYGIKDVVEVTGQDWQYEGTYGDGASEKTVRIYTRADGIIIKVTDESENVIKGTTIDEVSNRVDNVMNVLTLPDVIDVDPTSSIMAYIGYGITDVITSSGTNNGKEYSYVAKYKEGVNEIPVYISVKTVEGKAVIDSVWKGDGSLVGGTSISDVNTRVENITDVLTLPEFVDVKADDAIMAYIGYGVYGVEKVDGQDWQYEGSFDTGTETITVRIYADTATQIIDKVTKADGEQISGTTIEGVSARVEKIMDVLTLPEFINIDPDDAIMAYLGYGIYDVTAQDGTDVNTGKAYSYVGKYKQGADEVSVYVSTKDVEGKAYVSSVWIADNGNKVKGTSINDVSSRLSGIEDAITIAEFVDIDPDDAILAYLGYGVYDVIAQSGTNNGKAYTHVAKYDNAGTEVTVYVASEANKITSVWLADGSLVSGTKISKVADRLDNITNVISISAFIDIDATDAILAYLGYCVYDVVEVAGQDWQYEATYGEGVDAIAVRIYTDANNIITKVTDTTVEQNVINGTKIGKVADRLDGITNVIAITEFMDIDPTDAIMAYMGYGINGVVAENGTDSLGNSYAYKAKYGTYVCYMTVDANSKIDAIWYVDGGTKVAISGTKIGNVPDRISSLQNTLTIGEIVEVDSSSSKILQAIQYSTISDLDTTINTLKVKDVLTDEQINNNSVLPQLKDTLITELGSEIDKVLIQRIYAKEVYELAEDGDPTDNTTYNSAYLYYEKIGNETEGYKYQIVDINCQGYAEGSTEYDNALGKLTEEQFNAGAGKYYTYGEAKGMWKLILYRMESDGTKTEKAYTLNNFDYMVNTCSDIVYNSTLDELKSAGIIGSDIDATALDKKLRTVYYVDTLPAVGYIKLENGVPTTVDNESEATRLGDYTLKQLLVAITSML